MGCGASQDTDEQRHQNPGRVVRRGGGGAPAAGGAGGGLPGAGMIASVRPWKHTSEVTPAQLDRMREHFWGGTAGNGGQPAIWEALRLACGLMLNGEVENASGILETTGIRLPNGTLERCYDARGAQYAVPLYCFSNPTNLITEAELKRRMEVAPHQGPASELPVKVRISSGGERIEQDMQLALRTNTTVAEVKRLIHEELLSGRWDEKDGSPNKWAGDGLPTQRQRLLYRGAILADSVHMQAAGVQPGSFLQVFVRPERT